MKYMGSKRRIAKEIIPIITKGIDINTPYYEPFVGGGNMIDKVPLNNKFGNDIDEYVIAFFKACISGWLPPEFVSEEEFYRVKNNKENYAKEYVAHVLINCSFGCNKSCYARDNTLKQNYSAEGRRNIINQFPNIKNITFTNMNYYELDIPDNAVVYCDPPYANTEKYHKGGFDNKAFWIWAEQLSKRCKVFVSEYNAPKNWYCIWEKEVKTSTNQFLKIKRLEKLFILKK